MESILNNKKLRRALFLVFFCFVVFFALSIVKTDSEDNLSDLLFGSFSGSLERASLIEARHNIYEPLPLLFVQEDSITGVSAPVMISPQILGALSEGYGPTDFSVEDKEIREYRIQEGDTLSSVAERFNISQDTIIWANNDIKGESLRPDQSLTILPTSGAFHLVRENDTLSEVAGWYKADIEKIISYNEISSADQIIAGDFLIIPDGIKPSSLPSPRSVSSSGSNFGYPVPGPIRITQGLHHYNAIDFGAPCGTPVYASERGTVQRTGYHPVGGNYVRILHDNGIVTYYGHLQSHRFVNSGQRVSRGQTIGHIGLTGYTTGCHVHFEFRSPTGSRNPFAR